MCPRTGITPLPHMDEVKTLLYAASDIIIITWDIFEEMRTCPNNLE